MSDIRPGSKELRDLEKEILSILPADWKKETESIVLLIDVSASMKLAENKVFEKAGEIYSVKQIIADPASVVMLFSDTVIVKKSFDEVDDFFQDFSSSKGGGTDIQGALSEAIAHLRTLPSPRKIFLFTDGDGLTDVEWLNKEIREHSILLEVLSTNIFNDTHLMTALISKVEGSYSKLNLM
jgi:uncharacterized protein with von Willebrand factor type A (vWA) domain